MSKNQPLVSIGLAVYNGENYIRETLESLLNQTFSDFELIISDNASIDRTNEICLEYAAKDGRIRYERSPVNRGAAWNQNRVAFLAKGKYFKLASHDDICAPEFLEKCLQPLEADSSIVLSYPKTQIINEVGEIIDSGEDGNLKYKNSKLGQAARFLLKPILGDSQVRLDSAKPRVRFRSVVCNMGKMHPVFGLIRMSAIKGKKLFGAYGHADNVFLSQLALQGKFYEVPEYLFFSRRHPQQSSMLFLKGNKQDFISYAVWWNPQNKGKVSLQRWIIFREYCRVIDETNISLEDKICCYFDAWRWLRGNWKFLLEECIALVSPSSILSNIKRSLYYGHFK